MTETQIGQLADSLGMSRANVIQTAVDRLFQQEKPMKQIETGETNDLHLYAVETDGRYYPLSESDLNFEQPDAKIYYDSGIYPGVTDLEQYVCDKASNQKETQSMTTETKNKTTYYVHEDQLGDIGTEAQARRMVEFLRERGYDVEYGQSIEQDEYAIADQDWHDGLDVLSAETVE